MKIFQKIMKSFVILTVPFMILMAVVLVIFRPWFLIYEYDKADFPPDPYGFTKEERLDYGIRSMTAITAMSPGETFAEMTNEQGEPIYTDREISHMLDVRKTFQTAKFVFGVFLLVYLLILFRVLRNPRGLLDLLQSIIHGSILSAALLLLILNGTLFAFDSFFAFFHSLFFAADSWLFYMDDMLIRLYPQKLWVDAFIFVGVLSLFFSLFFIYLGKGASRQITIQPRNKPTQE